MKAWKLFTGIAVSGLLILGSSGCTSKISEEQLAQLQELKRREASLREELRTRRADIAQLGTELQKRKQEAEDCQKRLEFVKSKLAQWPNVWPETKPLLPTSEE